MSFSEYLNGKREICRELIAELGRTFSYVSILGTDVHATIYRTDRRSSQARLIPVFAFKLQALDKASGCMGKRPEFLAECEWNGILQARSSHFDDIGKFRCLLL